MLRLIEENLVRQNKAMMLMFFLLEEEFARLTKLKPQSVSRLELSLQELMRQVAAERASLRTMVRRVESSANRVRDLYPGLDKAMAETFRELLDMLDATEQKCAVQASKNGEMARALHDQSKELLQFMHNQIKPKNTTAYARSGRFAQAPSNARLLTGRL
ncbi:MAG: flagellar export chaperone FlgN [Desulfovibrionaceae bacterium]|nr:flagellar export chaperone FlgN [Desulfovibrionaceae bacterium]